METYIKRDYQKNWVAATEIAIEDDRVVTIRTRKSSSGALVTYVSVGKSRDGFISHMMFHDYNKSAMVSNPKRITEKLVSAQHDKVLSGIDALLADINEFYSKEIA